MKGTHEKKKNGSGPRRAGAAGTNYKSREERSKGSHSGKGGMRKGGNPELQKHNHAPFNSPKNKD